MRSRLLTSLATEAGGTDDPETWARAVCRSASHFARQGHTKQALQAIDSVRSKFARNLTPSIGAWLMLAEGVLHFFQEDISAAFDRTRRSYAIAKAANLRAVVPTCAAWMALIEFNALRYEQMALHLEEAFAVAAPDDHQALARASLVLADALHFAGDFKAARPFYERTRLHATAEGDEATLSAMLHNVAAFRVGNVRMADAVGIAAPEEAKRAMMEANSALNFDAAIGTASFTMLVPLLRGQLLTVERKYAEAEKVLLAIDRAALEAKSVPLLLVDLGWCYAAQGKLEAAKMLADEVPALLTSETHIDEIAFINARLAQVAMSRSEFDTAANCRTAAVAAIAVHNDVQQKLASRLASVVEISRTPPKAQ